MLSVFAYSNKHVMHIQINQFVGIKLIDSFFYYITYLGDGILGAIIVGITLLVNVRLGLYIGLSLILSALITNTLKYHFFNDFDRPFWDWQYVIGYSVKKVEGVDLHIKKSFPSGHATQAFAIFFAFALAAKKIQFKYLFFFIAILTAFSRVYLSQHWLQDITAGSFVGVFSSLLFYFVFYNKTGGKRIDKSIIKLIKR
ncbi:MAG: phosphatase PAP2 family protein [Bacteroidia bacterium]